MIDGSLPECLMARNPSARPFKGLPAQPELMNSPFHRAFDYPGLLQHFQVLGNGGLGGAELAAKFAGVASLAARERMNHRTSGAVGESVKSKIEIRAAMHSHMTIYCRDGVRKTKFNGAGNVK